MACGATMIVFASGRFTRGSMDEAACADGPSVACDAPRWVQPYERDVLCSARVGAISVRHGGGGEFHVPQADCADVYHRRRAEYRARIAFASGRFTRGSMDEVACANGLSVACDASRWM